MLRQPIRTLAAVLLCVAGCLSAPAGPRRQPRP